MSGLLWDPLLSCGAPRMASWPLELPLALALAWVCWRRRGSLAGALKAAALLLGLSAFWILPALERVSASGWRGGWPAWFMAQDPKSSSLKMQLRDSRLGPKAGSSLDPSKLAAGLKGVPLLWGSRGESKAVSLLNRLILQGGPESESLLSLSGAGAIHDGASWALRRPFVRAAFVERARFRDGSAESLKSAAQPFFSRPLFLEEGHPMADPKAMSGNWTLLSPAGDGGHWRVALPELHGNGWLYLSDSYYPGWVAKVDGKRRPILRSELAFRAVFVQAGEKEAVFTYRPLSFYFGLGISLLTLAFLLWPGLGALVFRAQPQVDK